MLSTFPWPSGPVVWLAVLSIPCPSPPARVGLCRQRSGVTAVLWARQARGGLNGSAAAPSPPAQSLPVPGRVPFPKGQERGWCSGLGSVLLGPASVLSRSWIVFHPLLGVRSIAKSRLKHRAFLSKL